MTVQIYTDYVLNTPDANLKLRNFQKVFPQREIIGVSMTPTTPDGWFMIITYKIKG